MKQWVFAVLTMCFAACAAEVLDEVDDVEARDEELSISCRAAADAGAKQYLEFIFGVGDDQLHWYADEGAYQIGGVRWNQPVRGRGIFRPSIAGTRAVDVTICDPDARCAYWATYVCGCDGFYSCEFK